jgi:hypothetical protein
VRLDHSQRALADRARRSEDRDSLHRQALTPNATATRVATKTRRHEDQMVLFRAFVPSWRSQAVSFIS